MARSLSGASYIAYAPLFVIPVTLAVVPRAPPHLRGPIFGGAIAIFGSFSLHKYFTGQS